MPEVVSTWSAGLTPRHTQRQQVAASKQSTCRTRLRAVHSVVPAQRLLRNGTLRCAASRRDDDDCERMQAQSKRDVAEDAANAVSDAAREQLERAARTSFIQQFVSAHNELNRRGVSWSTFLGLSLLVGVTFGSFFQTTHNNGFLPMYDVWRFKIGTAVQSGVVPLLLAPIWLLGPYLQVVLDKMYEGDEATIRANERARSLAFVALNWGYMACTFILSDWVYMEKLPHWECSAILAVTAVACWGFFDRTKQGAFLAALLAVGAPLTEVFIVNVLHLWHYDRPDFFGVPHWAGWCYAQYAQGVGNWGRYLAQRQANERLFSVSKD